MLINRGFLWRTDVCLLTNGPGNWDTRRKRGGVSWWGEQHHQRGRAYASTRSRSPRYTERCLLRSITQNGACSDVPLGLMRLPYRTFLHQYRNFLGTHSPDIQTIQSDYTAAASRYYCHITNRRDRTSAQQNIAEQSRAQQSIAEHSRQ